MAVTRSVSADSALRGELIDVFVSGRHAPPPTPTNVLRRLGELREVRCILFDVYGTLFVSASGDVGTSQASSEDANFRQALKRAGFGLTAENSARHARSRYFAAIGRRHTAARSRGTQYPEVDIAEVWEEVLGGLLRDGLIAYTASPGKSGNQRSELAAFRVAALYESISNPVGPMPDAKPTIGALASAQFLLGIVSNAQFYTPLLFPSFFAKELTELGFREDLCSWSYEIGKAKPSPEVFIPVLERLAESERIGPESVLYVGNDMLNDIWAAHEVGCRTALFAGDERSLRLRQDEARCLTLRPDIVVLRLSDLLEALKVEPPSGEKGNRG